ncbi:MAG TPA: pseudouridine synthase [Crocinitomicaceae bacterium]|nr:pseudouridine synthase [Crocinitomicaceae bacterium]
MNLKRLNKAIAETGYCSRRGADKLIEEGRVKVNNELAGLGVKVTATDIISVNGQVITKDVENLYFVFNKPTGITCTTDENIKGNIISFINYPERIFPVGRLDKPSEGLIFLTNDGDIVNKILRSRNNHEKEYIVGVNKKITEWFLNKMRNGLPILETVTKKCVVEKIDDYSFKIILTQGLNRQIRRMCEHLNYEVRTLKRVRIMNVELNRLKKGQLRSFTKEEFEGLLHLIGDSSKTEEASE